MAFTKKNVTRSKYTRAKRVKRVKKTNKRRSQKCVKGGGGEENNNEDLKIIVNTINIRSRNVDYYLIINKKDDENYTIQKFTSPTIKKTFLKGSKSNFNILDFELGETKDIKRNQILPSLDLLNFKQSEEELEEYKFNSVLVNTMRRLKPGCILKYHDFTKKYELDVSLTEQYTVATMYNKIIKKGGNKKIGG